MANLRISLQNYFWVILETGDKAVETVLFYQFYPITEASGKTPTKKNESRVILLSWKYVPPCLFGVSEPPLKSTSKFLGNFKNPGILPI